MKQDMVALLIVVASSVVSIAFSVASCAVNAETYRNIRETQMLQRMIR